MPKGPGMDRYEAANYWIGENFADQGNLMKFKRLRNLAQPLGRLSKFSFMNLSSTRRGVYKKAREVLNSAQNHAQSSTGLGRAPNLRPRFVRRL